MLAIMAVTVERHHALVKASLPVNSTAALLQVERMSTDARVFLQAQNVVTCSAG